MQQNLEKPFDKEKQRATIFTERKKERQTLNLRPLSRGWVANAD